MLSWAVLLLGLAVLSLLLHTGSTRVLQALRNSHPFKDLGESLGGMLRQTGPKGDWIAKFFHSNTGHAIASILKIGMLLSVLLGFVLGSLELVLLRYKAPSLDTIATRVGVVGAVVGVVALALHKASRIDRFLSQPLRAIGRRLSWWSTRVVLGVFVLASRWTRGLSILLLLLGTGGLVYLWARQATGTVTDKEATLIPACVGLLMYLSAVVVPFCLAVFWVARRVVLTTSRLGRRGTLCALMTLFACWLAEHLLLVAFVQFTGPVPHPEEVTFLLPIVRGLLAIVSASFAAVVALHAIQVWTTTIWHSSRTFGDALQRTAAVFGVAAGVLLIWQVAL